MPGKKSTLQGGEGREANTTRVECAQGSRMVFSGRNFLAVKVPCVKEEKEIRERLNESHARWREKRCIPGSFTDGRGKKNHVTPRGQEESLLGLRRRGRSLILSGQRRAFVSWSAHRTEKRKRRRRARERRRRGKEISSGKKKTRVS